MKEVCSCTAAFEIHDVNLWTTEALLEAFAIWRANHRHDSGNHDVPLSSENGDTSMIVESSSSHERAIPLGFAPEPEGGWHE